MFPPKMAHFQVVQVFQVSRFDINPGNAGVLNTIQSYLEQRVAFSIG